MDKQLHVTSDHQPRRDSGYRGTRGTENMRRICTEGLDGHNTSPERENQQLGDDMGNDDSFSFPTTQSCSWESQSDSEDRARGHSRRERRKYDTTTPTLIDEEDDLEEEAEMVSLERARLRHHVRGVIPEDSSSLRRTPGASMYKSSLQQQQQRQQQQQQLQQQHLSAASLRRTPGASDMHRSAGMALDAAGDSTVLGFGLTLSTPVGGNVRNFKDKMKVWEAYSSESPSPSPRSARPATTATTGPPQQHPAAQTQAQTQTQQTGQRASLPVDRSQQPQRGDFFFDPWTLSKGTQLEVQQQNHGACSPNTLRLTEDLGNLLFEEEEPVSHDFRTNQSVFRGDNATTPKMPSTRLQTENLQDTNDVSWTSSYIFDSDKMGHVPSRVPRSGMGNRGRRSKNDANRRSRAGNTDRPPIKRDEAEQQFGFLPCAQQPKAVRSVQSAYLGNQNLFGSASGLQNRNAAGNYQPKVNNDDQRSSPRSLNFGGAFAPPSKDVSANFRRSVTSTMDDNNNPPSSGGPLFPVRTQQPHQRQQDSSHEQQGRRGPSINFHCHTFQPLPPPSSAHGTSRHSPFQHAPDPNNYGHTTMPSNPEFGSYPMHHPRMQAPPPPAHDFYAMAHPQAPVPQQFPSQEWPAVVPMYDGGMNRGNWPSMPGGWVAGGEYGYGVPPPSQGGPADCRGIAISPIPQVPSWHDPRVSPGLADFPPFQVGTTDFFGVVPQSQHDLPPHPAAGASTGTPALSGGGPMMRRDPHHRPKRDGNVRKGAPSRKTSKQQQSKNNEKGKKPDNSGLASFTTTTRKTSINNARKKKQNKGKDSTTGPEGVDQLNACVTSSSNATAMVGSTEEGAISTSEDPANLKRSELVESPATRSAFKEFYRKYRAEERSSFQDAEDFALQSLGDGSLPEKVHWRVYLELADLAKRSNRFVEARQLYQQVCQLQPYASQGWLEYSKLEEECGYLHRGAKILHAGLEYCEYSENLLTRAIKHEEKMGNLNRARELLARLKHVGIEKVWRTVLEGALLEARAGNEVMARRVLKYLMHHVPWYGPLYLEAYRLERDLGRPAEALAVVERGVAAIPRYGPLWFGAFRLCEDMDIGDKAYDLPKTMNMVERAISNISKELIWKVHLDMAQMLERAALDQRATTGQFRSQSKLNFDSILSSCRHRFTMTILTCPPNLRWKVWLAAGRMEVAAGNASRARLLFRRANQVVPEKGRATTLLECARLEEFAGDPELASAILCKSRYDYSSDWKVWLESVLLEIRGGNYSRAIELAKAALEIHPGTGRLWAALVQLHFFTGGEESQFCSLKRALNAVPKSGEVWCEGGRIHLNPFSKSFDLEKARRHLFFATRFTPQYGDSFLETLRLELLEQWIAPIATLIWKSTSSQVLSSGSSDEESNLISYVSDIALTTLTISGSSRGASKGKKNLFEDLPSCIPPDIAMQIHQRLDPAFQEQSVDTTDLELRCANADPNYGLLWFHCRLGPTDTARRILSRASVKVVADLRKFAHIYIAARIRRLAVLSMTQEKHTQGIAPHTAQWEKVIDDRLLAAPSLGTIFERGMDQRETGLVLQESTSNGSIFATGLAELNRHRPIEEMSLNERRKALFGTDALFS